MPIASKSKSEPALEETYHVSAIKSINQEKRIVYGLVYEPDVLDSHGEFMSAEDIEKMAHRYMQIEELNKTIDVNHDQIAIDAYPVESYIAKEGDPNFTEGSWVLGVKVNDPSVWEDIKSGKLGGFSWQAMVKKSLARVEYDYIRHSFGKTEDYEGHSHVFFAEFDEDGKIVGGRTSTDHGHSHEIVKGTTTEFAGDKRHKHRFFVY